MTLNFRARALRVIREDTTRQPAPTRYNPNWRCDRCENRDRSGDAVEEALAASLLVGMI